MPSRVSAERNLCAQIAATATFNTSKRFTCSITDDEGVWLPIPERLCQKPDRQGGLFPMSVPSLTVGLLTRQAYSYLNDSIGSSRAAFQAGHSPKTIPTAAEMPTPTPIAQAGTNAGRGEYLFM